MECKFKVGDKVRYKSSNIWSTQTIEGIYKDCYKFDEISPLSINYVDENFVLVEEDSCDSKVHKPKFKVGDKISNIWSDNEYNVKEITKGGYRLDDRYITFGDEYCWNLASEKNLAVKSKKSFDTDDSNDLFKIFNKHINNAFCEIAERNKIEFYNLIEKTLRFVDCEAYTDSARIGMRLFANELKSRLGVNNE